MIKLLFVVGEVVYYKNSLYFIDAIGLYGAGIVLRSDHKIMHYVQFSEITSAPGATR